MALTHTNALSFSLRLYHSWLCLSGRRFHSKLCPCPPYTSQATNDQSVSIIITQQWIHWIDKSLTAAGSREIRSDLYHWWCFSSLRIEIKPYQTHQKIVHRHPSIPTSPSSDRIDLWSWTFSLFLGSSTTCLLTCWPIPECLPSSWNSWTQCKWIKHTFFGYNKSTTFEFCYVVRCGWERVLLHLSFP